MADPIEKNSWLKDVTQLVVALTALAVALTAAWKSTQNQGRIDKHADAIAVNSAKMDETQKQVDTVQQAAKTAEITSAKHEEVIGQLKTEVQKIEKKQ